ncbi:hypothetical protein Mal64_05920 [Pseudobythopirellula maris]|uniref:PEP-CTERM protein-sorting domain-containing protein n=1 Tax=Pseudobythopirellula maris TaxID=2527991 RepID=A0A5C5ZT13_9BACT|nr:PEP-CTERM sorting domain-containing protein [Pseudobythopirellula maris]TWT90208.1 hypothetical protein Mal64_05920 [Pseudobythopirellula maris]
MNIRSKLIAATLGVGLMAMASSASAAFTYFDADLIGYTLAGSKTSPETPVAPNTTMVNGDPVPYVIGVGSGGTGWDNLWRIRENDGFGNRATGSPVVAGGTKPSADNGSGEQLIGDIIEARGDFGADNSENVPTLKTTVDVDPSDEGQEKAVYAFFWTAGTAGWQMSASLTNSSNLGPPTPSNPLQPVFQAGATGQVAYGETLGESNTTHLFNVFDASTESGTPPVDAVFQNPLYASNDLLLTSSDGSNSGGAAGDRQLWAAFLGNVTLGDELSVFISEGFSLGNLSGGNNRTWYDGIGYGDPIQGLSELPELVIPEPSAIALLSVVGITCLGRRRNRS